MRIKLLWNASECLLCVFLIKDSRENDDFKLKKIIIIISPHCTRHLMTNRQSDSSFTARRPTNLLRLEADGHQPVTAACLGVCPPPPKRLQLIFLQIPGNLRKLQVCLHKGFNWKTGGEWTRQSDLTDVNLQEKTQRNFRGIDGKRRKYPEAFVQCDLLQTKNKQKKRSTGIFSLLRPKKTNSVSDCTWRFIVQKGRAAENEEWRWRVEFNCNQRSWESRLLQAENSKQLRGTFIFPDGPWTPRPHEDPDLITRT